MSKTLDSKWLWATDIFTRERGEERGHAIFSNPVNPYIILIAERLWDKKFRMF